MRKFLEQYGFYIILWLLLLIIFFVGGMYFEHVKIQTSTIWQFARLLGGN